MSFTGIRCRQIPGLPDARVWELGEPDEVLPGGRPAYYISETALVGDPMIARELFEHHALLPMRRDRVAARVLFSPISDLPALIETVTKTRLAPQDIIVVKAAWANSRSQIQFAVSLLKDRAGWEGVLVPLEPDEDFFTLPEEAQRRLYESLKRKFG
jgi:hypothetical protein